MLYNVTRINNYVLYYNTTIDSDMKEKAKKSNKKWIVLFLIFLIVAIASLCWIIVQALIKNNANEQYEKLQQEVASPSIDDVIKEAVVSVSTDETIDEKLPAREAYIIPSKEIDWDKLYKVNKDIYAWISVSGTTIDYPVLQHPSIRLFYLKHNLNGSFGFPGCIFTENYNSKDFSDVNTVLYGHRMKDQTMFTTLHNFDDTEYFNKDNYYIYIYTPEYTYVYLIFAAMEFKSVDLMEVYDFSNEYVFTDFINELYRYDKGTVKNIREDIEISSKDKIITLSTCTLDSRYDKRAMVFGVLVNAPQKDREGFDDIFNQ